MAYNLLSHEIQGSYDLRKEALREKFKPASKKEHYKLEFESRRKNTVKSWAVFGYDLHSLADKAFPELQEEAREHLALIHYLNQLESQEIAFTVRQQKPQTIREAVTLTFEFESYLLANNTGHNMHQSSEPSLTSNQPLHQLQCLAEALQQLQLRLSDLEAGALNLPSTPPAPRRRNKHPSLNIRNVLRKRLIICRKCKKIGHYARGCASGRSQPNTSVVRDKGPQS